MEAVHTQRDKVIRLLSDRTMARAHEIRMEGITATTLARAVEDGKVLRKLYMCASEVPNLRPSRFKWLKTVIYYNSSGKMIPRGILFMAKLD